MHACMALKKSMYRNGLLLQDRIINYRSHCFGAPYLVGAMQKLRPLTFFNHAFSLTALSSERAYPKATKNGQATTKSSKFCQTDLSTWKWHTEETAMKLAEDEETQLQSNSTRQSSLSCLSKWLSSLL
jgi:hypothetical protein